MPGRTARASGTVSGTATKARSTRASKPTRPSSSSDIDTPEESPDSSLRRAVCSLFYDAQKTTAGHRKLVVSLRKLQETCAYEPTSTSGKQSGSEFDEEDFNAEVTRCVLRVLPVKKSEGAADKVIKYMTSFLRYASEKDAELAPENEEDDESLETPTTRLTGGILSMVNPLLSSKDKVVRYRATQIIRHVISSLDSIDDDIYHLLRSGLVKRVRDREAMVRVQAVLGLTHLLGNEDGAEGGDDDDDEDMGLLEKLLDVLQNDPSADVRKSLLLNLPLTPTTLPYLLERARDVDPATRRALYSKLLPALGDFRHLSLSMREKLLRWGLRDRDENVQKATARLFREHWIEDIAGAGIAEDDAKPGQPAPANVDSLLELMERIDITNSGGSEGIALPAFKEFWAGRPDYVEAVSFQDPFWDNLSAESVFMVRSFNDFCRQDESKYGDLLEEKMPEVTKLAFMLERYNNKLIEILRRPDHTDEEVVEPEFIVEQLLYVTETLDYSDEIGRRKMFGLLREMIAAAELPEEITKLAVGVLRGVCGGDMMAERDFCGVVLEAIAEVHDTIADPEESMDPDESFHSAHSRVSDETPPQPAIKPMIKETADQGDAEKAIKEIMVNMKCLHIAQCMLQNVEGNLQDNVHLVTMLNNLVVPAVRSHEAPIRERGLQCLGLCCLLDKHLAEENMTLFIHCFSKGHPALQVHALETLCDIISVHSSLLAIQIPATPQPGATVATTEEAKESPHLKPILKAFSRALRSSADPSVHSTAISCLSKLFLTRVLIDDGLLQHMTLSFFDPATQDNHAARQALSYFLPAFCHSKRDNMEAMGRVACDVLKGLVSMHDELEEDEEGKEGMVGVSTAATMLADFTDARKLVIISESGAQQTLFEESEKKEEHVVDSDIHLDLLAEALERALTKGAEKEYRKALLVLAGKLAVTNASDQDKLLTAKELLSEALDGKLETSVKNALTKLQAAVFKAMESSETDKKRRVRKSTAPIKQSIEADDQTETPGEKEVDDQTGILAEREDDDDDTVTIKAEDDVADTTTAEDDMADTTTVEDDVADTTATEDSIVDELLDDEDTIMEGA